jgi:serine/threonine protein kinase
MKQVGEYHITNYNIAKGAFASIHKGKHIYSNCKVAIKEIKLNGGQIKNYVKREIEIHRSLEHPNIVKVLDVVYEPSSIYIIMEYCQYGDLQKFQNKKPFSHKYIQYYMLQLRDALQYLRSKNIVHRDLKPQNILLTSPLQIKITDFGLARYINIDKDKYNDLHNTPPEHEDLFSTYCGSPIYMSPELLNHQQYNSKSDLWSIGIILYELITGIPPFIANNLKQLTHKINTEKINLDCIDKTLITDNCFDLLRNLLSHDKTHRADWDYFFNHKWFSSIVLVEEENRLIENPLCYELLEPRPANNLVDSGNNNLDNNRQIDSYKHSVNSSISTTNVIASAMVNSNNSGLKFSDHLNINSVPEQNINSPKQERRHTSIDKNFTFSLKSSRIKDESKLSQSNSISQFNLINLSDLKQDDNLSSPENSLTTTSSPKLNKLVSQPINIIGGNARNNIRTPTSSASNSSNSNPQTNSGYGGTSSPSRSQISRNENNTASPRAIINALQFIKETYNYLSSDNKSL